MACTVNEFLIKFLLMFGNVELSINFMKQNLLIVNNFLKHVKRQSTALKFKIDTE